jgi:hypothetical protein
MEEKKKYIDEIFHFKGKWEMPSLCGVYIRKKEQGTLVILTEMYEENPGSSVTGMVEPIATEVVGKYNIDPVAAEFIVHNPERSSKYEFFAEMFYRAKMQWDGEKYLGVEWEKIEF